MTRWDRWSPVSGIVFVGLFVLAGIVLGTTGDTPEEVREHYIDNGGRVFTAFFILVASTLAFLWFVATLRSVLARAENEPRPFTALGFGAGVATSALLVAGGALIVANAEQDESLDAGAADLADTTAYFLITGGVMVASLLVFATSVVALRTRVLPAWLAWSGFAVALLTLFAPFFLPLFVFLAWVVVVSVVLLGGRATAPTAAGPAQPSIS